MSNVDPEPKAEPQATAGAPRAGDIHGSGVLSLCAVASYFRIAADPGYIRHQLALPPGESSVEDVLRAARFIGLKARASRKLDAKRLKTLPHPTIFRLKTGSYVIFGGLAPADHFRLFDPTTNTDRMLTAEAILAEVEPVAILVATRLGGVGSTPENFGFYWFASVIWRYRRPIGHVLLASFLVQIFALVAPLFFQVVIDKVLAHRSYSTLFVIVAGLVLIGIFDVTIQFLRSYALNHTTSRIDVELGQQLFAHLMRLPLSYFETRPAGQTVARMRELETIRQFLTGQGIFSLLDLFFAIVFIAVLFAYSWKLALIVVMTIPLYLLVVVLISPPLKQKTNEKFNRASLSQQFLVESVVGIQTIKASAIEPMVRAEWEDRLAANVRTGFEASVIGATGQAGIQLIDKLARALLLLFGAKAVIDGDMTVGSLVAFNMIAGQVSQPILRLSQLGQDFQQIQIAVARVGDILNAAPEPSSQAMGSLPPPRGAISIKNVSFRYRPDGNDILRNISLDIAPGEVIGIVGPSGSGKSSLTKLVQRLYLPHDGQILVDGVDIAHADAAWLRRHVGVVLQENLLFNRTIHENIALGNPALPRPHVINLARLAGADEFIRKLPMGYDTPVQERGTNFSGGQRQRIAIARALATNPRILILDEATSALDYESERIVQANMREIIKGRTVLVIAHRLAAVRHCNRIVSIVDGRIVEIGTHDELLKRPDSFYGRLWSLQHANS